MTELVEKDIIMLSQICNEEGNIYEYNDFIMTYNLSISRKHFRIIESSIPSAILTLQQNSTHTNTRSDLHPLIQGVSLVDRRCSNKFLRRVCQHKAYSIAQNRWHILY